MKTSEKDGYFSRVLRSNEQKSLRKHPSLLYSLFCTQFSISFNVIERLKFFPPIENSSKHSECDNEFQQNNP